MTYTLGPAKAIPPFLNVMFFIDGGYLRKGFKDFVGHENIRLPELVRNLLNFELRFDDTKGEIVRIYYYDAQVEASDDPKKSEEQRIYFHDIGRLPDFEIRLGRLVKTGSGNYRQKGVDLLVAIDMLAKAFQNFYDVAVFIGGDDDFVDLMKTIKSLTNKRIYGICFKQNVSKRLLESFDRSAFITEEICRSYTLVKPQTKE